MSGRLYQGTWQTKEQWETSDSGEFKRQQSSFRKWIRDTTDASYPAQSDRYHLYVSLACPWAHRVLTLIALKKLQHAVSFTIVHPYMGENGWEFGDEQGQPQPEPHRGARFLWEIYRDAKHDYTGRATVPVLWDKKTSTIVNNESRDILRMLDKSMHRFAERDIDLCPEHLETQVDECIDRIYQPINNGVYRCGFAQKQSAYEAAYQKLFTALDEWDQKLANQRFVCGDQLTEADICLFTTLIRFDPVYYVHFKCNRQLIMQYPNLSGYVRDIYQLPDVATYCDFGHIKTHYYSSHKQLNPSGFVAAGPDLSYLTAPNTRAQRFNKANVAPI